jgi:uncharacterized membrane protein YtjA (UPF0391 family)
MNIASIVHFVFLVFFVSLPFWPADTMFAVRWIPMGLISIWFIFNGCPLTHIDKSLNDQTFTEIFTKPLCGDIGEERVISLTYLVLFLVTILCTQKYYEFIFR